MAIKRLEREGQYEAQRDRTYEPQINQAVASLNPMGDAIRSAQQVQQMGLQNDEASQRKEMNRARLATEHLRRQEWGRRIGMMQSEDALKRQMAETKMLTAQASMAHAEANKMSAEERQREREDRNKRYNPTWQGVQWTLPNGKRMALVPQQTPDGPRLRPIEVSATDSGDLRSAQIEFDAARKALSEGQDLSPADKAAVERVRDLASNKMYGATGGKPIPRKFRGRIEPERYAEARKAGYTDKQIQAALEKANK